jgi:hypothetical protein
LTTISLSEIVKFSAITIGECSKLASVSIYNTTVTDPNTYYLNNVGNIALTIKKSANSSVASFNDSITWRTVTSLTIQEGITEIDKFGTTSSLTSLSIPSSIEKVNFTSGNISGTSLYTEYENAYYLGNSSNKYLILVKVKDTSLYSYTIHSNTKVICNLAFDGCANVTSITIPANVVYIGVNDFYSTNAFYGCSNLAAINVNANNANYSSINGVLYNKDQTILIFCPPKNQV